MRWSENINRSCGDEFQLLEWRGKFSFFLGLFAGRNRLAQAAGMPAIKRLGNRDLERTGAEIGGEHVRPRDGLEKRPMPTRHRDKREDDEHIGRLPEHARTIPNHRHRSNPEMRDELDRSDCLVAYSRTNAMSSVIIHLYMDAKP